MCTITCSISVTLSCKTMLCHFTAPSGTPLNFMYSQTTSGLVFTWDPPEASHRNGIITGYILHCTSTNTTVYSNYTNVTIETYLLNDANNCSLSAVNGAGTGPASTLVFMLSDTLVDGVMEASTFSSVMYYVAIPATVVIALAMVTIVALGITVCYYKRKITRYVLVNSRNKSMCNWNGE